MPTTPPPPITASNTLAVRSKGLCSEPLTRGGGVGGAAGWGREAKVNCFLEQMLANLFTINYLNSVPQASRCHRKENTAEKLPTPTD